MSCFYSLLTQQPITYILCIVEYTKESEPKRWDNEFECKGITEIYKASANGDGNDGATAKKHAHTHVSSTKLQENPIKRANHSLQCMW